MWEQCFKYFIEGSVDEKGKTKPKYKTTGSNALKYEEAIKKPLFGAILNENLIDISFDNADMGSVAMQMIKDKKWNCVVFNNPTNDHIHVVFKDSSKRLKSGADVKLSCGLIADIHRGNTYFRLREPDHERFPAIYESESFDEVPDEFLTITTSKKLWKMGEGSGRDSALFGYIQVLQTQLHLYHVQEGSG